MRNRELIERKLGHLDGIMVNLLNIVKTQQPLRAFIDQIEQAQSIIEETRSTLEMEPMTSEEWNNSKK